MHQSLLLLYIATVWYTSKLFVVGPPHSLLYDSEWF